MLANKGAGRFEQVADIKHMEDGHRKNQVGYSYGANAIAQ